MELGQALIGAMRSVECGSGAAVLVAEPTALQASTADLLLYVGDMLEELQCLCQRTGCPTLQGLLALARAEALLQQQRGQGAQRVG
jgi:hypothetical protein